MTADVTVVKAAVDAAFREEWGRVVATLIRVTGDWDLAEECAQDAFAMALQRWPADGVPRRPGAWLTTAARNRAIDVLRRRAVGAAKLREVAALSVDPEPSPAYESDHSGVPDDRLRLIFTCCHPALSLEARVALTLRTLAGLTTAEIARAFLSSEPTMAKRLVRAKQKIANAGIPYRVPPAHLLPERVPGVLGVLYLLFNEGYSATAGADLIRQGLSAEAIRLARVLDRLMPDEPEAAGLLALMLMHDARRAARLDADGEIVTLEDQDRGTQHVGRVGQVGRALEQRHHVEHGRPAAGRGVAGQFVHGGDVGGRAGEADHVAAARVHAVPVLHPGHRAERGQHLLGQRGQRRRGLGAGRAGVVLGAGRAGRAEFGQRPCVHLAVLPDLQAGQVEAERLRLPDEVLQLAAGLLGRARPRSATAGRCAGR